MMKPAKELRKLDPKKLYEEEGKLQKSLFKISFEVHNGQAKNSHEIKNHKKQIARIQTILNEKTNATEAGNNN